MAILGVESAIYGVDDLDLSTRFYEDFGLTLVSKKPDESVLEVASGAKVVLRRRGDARLPAAYSHTVGVHETIWGVDTQASLDRLVAGLSSDRKVTKDADGTVHFFTDDGMPLGLRLWQKRPVISVADPVNTPQTIRRLNQ